MNSLLKYIILLPLVFLMLEGCKKLPSFDKTPEIEFNGFEVHRNRLNSLSLSYEDSVVFKIKFQDGDGDLGMDEEDKKNDTLPNFIMKSYVKNNTPFLDSVTYKGQFQPLTLSAKTIKGPIKGELRYVQTFSYSDFSVRDSLRFSIQIKDREDNFSNIIMTDTLVVNNN